MSLPVILVRVRLDPSGVAYVNPEHIAAVVVVGGKAQLAYAVHDPATGQLTRVNLLDTPAELRKKLEGLAVVKEDV